MLDSRFAGIPISSSTIDGPGVPQLLNRGEQTLRAVTGSGGRLHFEPSRGVVAPGGDNRRANRHCAWGFLSTAVVTHRQIQSRYSHGEEDRGALLQCSSSRHGIQGSWGGSL